MYLLAPHNNYARLVTMNFWKELPKPIIVLAPLADVTDAAFRKLIAKLSKHVRADGTVGGPDVFWTEFVSADGLARATPEGRKKLMADLIYSEEERPIVAQLFSSTPEYMESAAKLCKELGFDGVDINMGCPDRSIEKQGCGSAMIKNPAKAREIIRAAKKGAGDMPVSVKTRLGYNEDELETWLPELLAEEPAVITIHARTRKEMSKVPARWERIARAAEIRDELGSDTLIFGNGDALSVADAREKVEKSGADGAMLGRAIFGNPWLFNPDKKLSENINSPEALSPSYRAAKYDSGEDDSSDDDSPEAEIITIRERLETLLEHTRLFVEMLPHKNFAVIKKHYKAYINGFPGAADLRAELMDTKNVEEVEAIVSRELAKM